MKKLQYALLAFALAFSAALVAQESGGQAAPAGQGGPHDRHLPTVAGQLDRLSTSLNLTDAQKPQIRTILEERDAKAREIMENRSASREDNMAKMRELHQSSNAKIRVLLTDEQKTKFDKMQEAEHRRHMGEGHGDHQGPPPPSQQ